MRPIELPAHWRTQAAALAAYGDERGATLLRTVADQLEAAVRDAGDETLDLQVASRESGYSVSRLRHMITEGTIPNAGRKHAPRIRRGDLPKRARRDAVDAEAIAGEILRGRRRSSPASR